MKLVLENGGRPVLCIPKQERIKFWEELYGACTVSKNSDLIRWLHTLCVYINSLKRFPTLRVKDNIEVWQGTHNMELDPEKLGLVVASSSKVVNIFAKNSLYLSALTLDECEKDIDNDELNRLITKFMVSTFNEYTNEADLSEEIVIDHELAKAAEVFGCDLLRAKQQGKRYILLLQEMEETMVPPKLYDSYDSEEELIKWMTFLKEHSLAIFNLAYCIDIETSSMTIVFDGNDL